MTRKHHAIIVRAWSHVREALCELDRLPSSALDGCEAVRLNPEVIDEARDLLRQIGDDVAFVVADGVFEQCRCRSRHKKVRAA